jgi:hypothetical protein
MLGLVVMASVGAATAPGATPPTAAVETPAYTVPVVVSDLIAFGILGTWLLTDDAIIPNGIVPLGAVGALVVAPIIHLGHGHPKRAAASFGLRVGGVLAGATTSLLVVRDCGGELCGLYWGVVGMIVGGGVGAIADAAYFTRGELLARKAPPVVVTPMITPTSAGLGFVGTW